MLKNSSLLNKVHRNSARKMTRTFQLQAWRLHCPINAQSGLLIANHVREFCYSFDYKENRLHLAQKNMNSEKNTSGQGQNQHQTQPTYDTTEHFVEGLFPTSRFLFCPYEFNDFLLFSSVSQHLQTAYYKTKKKITISV